MRLLKLAVIAYGVILLLLFLFQDKMLFHPRKVTEEEYRSYLARPGVEALEVNGPRGRLRGAIAFDTAASADEAQEGRTPVVLFFGGNGDQVFNRVLSRDNELPSGWAMASVPYPGYGLSDEDVSTENSLADSLAIFDAVAAHPKTDPNRVVVWAFSLGNGIAAHVAANRNVAGAILVSPYDVLSRVAQARMPIAPVKLLMRHEIDAESDARKARAPALITAGTADRTIPFERSVALKDAWGGDVTWIERKGGVHHDLVSAHFLDAMEQFLSDR